VLSPEFNESATTRKQTQSSAYPSEEAILLPSTLPSRAVGKGVTVVVAAGNDNDYASNYSPASESTAITIGAIDSDDNRASFSKYGSLIGVSDLTLIFLALGLEVPLLRTRLVVPVWLPHILRVLLCT